MDLKLISAILLGKFISFLTQTFKLGGGTAAPGLYGLKIDPDLVTKLSANLPKNIIITGTNGKTTTARLLAHFAKQYNILTLRNHTGSNLERGVASALIQSCQFGKTSFALNRFGLGIWELDEAAFNQVTGKIKPVAIVFLNIFRDQLDRYGEVDTLVKKWCQAVKTLNPQTEIFINGDDYNLQQIKQCFTGKVISFGLGDYKIAGEKVVHQVSKKHLDLEATQIKCKGLEETKFTVQEGKNTFQISLPLPGIYHIYDFLAAFALASFLDIPEKIITDSLSSFQPAFGRVEKLELPGKKQGFIFLIKNPVGATQVFQTIQPELNHQDRLLIALNDNLADGTDVSWIWDGQFEQLVTKYKYPVFVSGSRAQDLAVRLKYAGFDPKSLIINNDLEKSFKESQNNFAGRLFILPTYTALLELQKILTKQGRKQNYWEKEI